MPKLNPHYIVTLFVLLCCSAVWLLLTILIFGSAFYVFKIIYDDIVVDVSFAGILTLLWIMFCVRSIATFLKDQHED